jgi:antitoxin component of MazEF toxin-antitoxin module
MCIPCRYVCRTILGFQVGNNLAVRIHSGTARDARLAEGDRLTLELAEDGSIVLRSTRCRYELHELVSKISAKNRRQETDWERPVGKESW